MTSSPTTPESSAGRIPPADRVPVREKAAYAAGGVGAAIQNAADDVILAPIFVIGLGISPALMSVCGTLYRIWDALTDAIMGWLSDNTRTRWGRRRPWLLLGAILMPVSMPLLFFFDPTWPVHSIIAWMVVFQLFILLAQTVFNIPYQSLLMEISPNTHERMNVAAWRSYFGIAVGLCVGWTWWLTQQPYFQTGPDKTTNIVHAARWILGGYAVIVFALTALPALFTRERFYELAKSQRKEPFFRDLKLAFQNRSFLTLIGFIVLFSAGTNLINGIEYYTRFYHVCGGDQALASTLGGLKSTLMGIVGLAGIPVSQWASRRYGKKATLMAIVGMLVTGTLSMGLLYTPAFPYLSLLPPLLQAPAVTGMWVVVPSMWGDIADDDELNLGERREGIFASVFSWSLKFSLSIAALFSGFLVEWAGFDVAQRHNVPVGVINNMRILLLTTPLAFVAISLVFLAKYPLTNSRIQEIRALLEARRGKV